MLDRTFLPWDEPALPVAARRLADVYAADGELDLGDTLLVFPGQRAGRRLTELLIDEAEARSLVLTPPRTTTIGALPELLYDSPAPLAGSVLSRLVWTRVLRSLDSVRRAAVFPDPPEEDDLNGWTGLASVLLRLHRDVAGEGLDFGDVVRICREDEGYDDSRRWSVLAEVQQDYWRRLEALGYLDRTTARRRALDDGTIGAAGEVVLIGVVEMPGVVREMLLQADVPVWALVHAPEERDDDFDELGCVRTEVWSEIEVDIPEEVVALCGRPPSQADEAVRRLSGDGRELAPDEITVGVPNEEVVPYLQQRFRAYDIPHRYGGGTDLPLTGPYRLLKAVADYLEGTRFVDFAGLLRHPELFRRIDVPGLLETADEHFNERLPARVPTTGAATDGDGQPFRELIRSLEEHFEFGALTGRRALSEWMSEVLALLRRAYGGRTLSRTVPGDRNVVEALEAVRDAAAALSRVPAEVDVRCSGAAALRLLLTEMRDESVPPLPDDSAVEMLGWLELHLDDAPVLVITGFDEKHVPASVSADIFLPDALRGRLGLVDNNRRYARDVYLLSAIIASREEIHIIVGRRNAEGDPLRPSRLLLAASGPELAERARRLFTDDLPVPAPLPRLGVAPSEESSFRTPPKPVLTVDPIPVSLRVTDFRLLLQDPYRWALENGLGLEAVDDRRRELDGLQFGGLAHEVLHRFGESAEAGSEDPAAVRNQLYRLLDEEVDRRYPAPLAAVRLQVEQLRARLSDFAEWHAARVNQGWETVAVEIGTPEAGFPLEVDGEPIGIRGRIDRVDHHPETGRWEVLDYETSAKASDPDGVHRKRGEWIDLQLPLYRHLLPFFVEERGLPSEIVAPESDLDLGFVNLSRDGTDQAMAGWTLDELDGALAAARDVVRQLRTGIVNYQEDRDAPGGEAFASLLGKGHLRPGECLTEKRPGEARP